MSLRPFEELQAQLRPEALLGLLVSLALLSALAGYLYLLKPSLAEYRELAALQPAEALALATEHGPVTAQAIARAQVELGQLRERLYGGSSTVPLREMQAWVIERLDGISQRHAVELLSVSPGEGGRVLEFGEIPFDVQVRGGYFDLYAWLHDVEQELRPMAVKTFELKPEGDLGVSLELRLVSYRPPPEAT